MDIVDAHAHVYERLTGFGPRGEARAIGAGMVEWATGEREQCITVKSLLREKARLKVGLFVKTRVWILPRGAKSV